MKALFALLTAMTMTTVIGCSEPAEEGTAEKAGKEIDQTIEKAESYTSEKMKELGESIEKAGDDMEKKD